MVYTIISPEIQGQNNLCIAHMFLMISLQHVVLELQNENNPWILIHLGRIVCTKTPKRFLLRKIIKNKERIHMPYEYKDHSMNDIIFI